MAPNDTATKRENRVWISCPKNLFPVWKKLQLVYKDEDIWKLGLIPLAEKHHLLPEGFVDDSAPHLEMDAHVDVPLRVAAPGSTS